MDASRSDLEFTAEVLQIALDEGATTINVPDTVGYSLPSEYAAMWASCTGWCPGLADVVDLDPLPRRPGCGGGQLAGRSRGGLPPGGVRHQRHRRAGRQRLAGGDRDAVRRPRGRARLLDTGPDHRDRQDQPPDHAHDRLPGTAQQGDRRPQRVRPRVGHPPGRRAQGAHHVRDHGCGHHRPGQQPAGAGQALGPPRPAQRAGAAGLRDRRCRAEHRVQALQGGGRPQEDGHRTGPGGAGVRRDARDLGRLRAGELRDRRGLGPHAVRQGGRLAPGDGTGRAASPATVPWRPSSAP